MTSVGIPTITPPELSSVRGEDVVKFKEEYDQYLRNVGEANRNRTNTQRFPPCGIKACISAELLLSLTELKTFPDCDTITQVSDDHVKTWIESRARCSSDDMASHVKHAIGKLRFKTDKSDPQGACMQFFADVMTELRRNRVSRVLSDAPKALILQLLPKLEPPIVRETIQTAFEYWPKEEKYDFHHFRKKVSEISVESAKYALKRDRDVAPAASSSGERPIKRNKKNAKGNVKVVLESDKPLKSAKGRASGKTKAWSDPCLNPKCNKVHPVKDCEDTTEEEKKTLLKRHYDEKKKKLSRMSNHTQIDGRWSCMIEGLVPCTALGDIGADESAIPRCILNTICHEGIQVNVEQLSEPINLSAAVKLPENVKFTASARVKLSITLSLPCGPLRLRRIEFLVVDQDMDEILLGRPLLRCLGFDLSDHLEKVRNEMDNADIEYLMHSSLEYDSLKIASLPEYKGLWYNSTEEDPIPASESISEDVSVMDNADVDKELEAALLDASEKGMSEEGLQILRSMLHEFKDIFRTNMGPDPPASIDPLRIRMKEGCRPRRATQRRYAAPQRAFISSTIKNLEKSKAVYANPKATWASPALAVHKAGPEKFRFTVDLRGPNSETIPIASAMPDLEGMIASIAGSSLFAKLDMIHAFWQLALHPDSQECMSIQTPLGVYTPTRVLQGSTDAGNHFQSATAQVFSELQESLAQWQDDFLMHASNEGELLKLLRRYFELCSKFGLKLHASKCQFYLKEAKFCGRIIDQSGVRYDPRRMDTLMSMKFPEFASDLQQFLCATNWMRTSIPDYSRVVAPLHNLMEECYSKAGKRTKRAVRNISISGLWGATHTSAFNHIRDHLAQALKLAHPKADHNICLFADASETHWASVLTQVPKSEMHLDFDKQNHEPLSFLSGSFTGASRNWSIVEKEAFAVVESMTRLEYLTASQEVSLYTDHANLVYIFDPHGQNPGISRHTANKLMRWALKLSGFRYVIEHVSGERNVWADMLTRWAVKPRDKVQSKKLASLMLAPINSSLSTDYDWPSRECIRKSQQQSSLNPPASFRKKDCIYQNRAGVFWIPDNDQVLKLRILVAGHAGFSGHRGINTSTNSLKSHFYWKTLVKDMDSFCRSCLHCMLASSAEVIPRPLGHSLHADKPNHLIHFDYCYIGPSDDGETYVLILKDDFSSYVWLVPCSAADASTTADALIRWFAAFGTVPQWVSDQGSHFKNEVIRCLREKTHASHHFTLAYCPWTNGTVEVVCRELVRALRCILSEYQMPFKMWPSVLPVIQAILNNTPLERLGHRAPITAFTSLPADTPLAVIKQNLSRPNRCTEIDIIRARQVAHIDKVCEALEGIHREITGLVSASRAKRTKAHNKRTHIRACNFDVGDYVLWGTSQRGKLPKLTLRWKGPYQVVTVLSDFLFVIKDLQSGKEKTVHGTRLRFFRNSSFAVDEVCKEQLAFQENEFCVVEEIIDIRLHAGETQLLVKWIGFEDEEPGWENLTKIREDIPVLVQDFLTEVKTSGTARQKRIASSV